MREEGGGGGSSLLPEGRGGGALFPSSHLQLQILTKKVPKAPNLEGRGLCGLPPFPLTFMAVSAQDAAAGHLRPNGLCSMVARY